MVLRVIKIVLVAVTLTGGIVLSITVRTVPVAASAAKALRIVPAVLSAVKVLRIVRVVPTVRRLIRIVLAAVMATVAIVLNITVQTVLAVASATKVTGIVPVRISTNPRKNCVPMAGLNVPASKNLPPMVPAILKKRLYLNTLLIWIRIPQFA
jgi:hypothetical protein